MIGRWGVVDPLAEIYQGLSPFNYKLNNPTKYIDPNGMWVENPDSYSTDIPDEIRNFFSSHGSGAKEKPNGNCCPENETKPVEALSGFASKTVDFMNSPLTGVGILALEESSADVLKDANPFSRATGNLRVLNSLAGAMGKVGYLTGAISIRLDYKNTQKSSERFTYNTIVTSLPWAVEGGAATYSAVTGTALFGSTPAGWIAASIGLMGVAGGQVYDGVSWWIDEVSKGLGSISHEMKKGVNPNLLMPSDSLLKFNIIELENILPRVLELNGYTYKWKNKDYSESSVESSLDIGLIAQEVELYFPEIVVNDENGTKLIAYYKLIPVLIEALKEQNKILCDQENLIAQQQKN